MFGLAYVGSDVDGIVVCGVGAGDDIWAAVGDLVVMAFSM